MKNFNLTTRKALRLAASASLALVAMVSSAHAQQSVTHVVELKSGLNSSNQVTPITFGDPDPNIRTYVLGNGGGWTAGNVSLLDFADAESGTNALLVDPSNAGWSASSLDTDANWIHSKANSGVDENVLYAHTFDLPADMPDDASVTLEIDFRVDNMLAGIYFREFGTSGAPTPVPGVVPAGSWGSVTSYSVTVDADDLGLVAGQNTFFLHQHSYSQNAYAGLQYSATLTASWCEVRREIRSGMQYDDNFGWYSSYVGATDYNVRTATLPEVYTSADLNAAFAALAPLGSGPNATTIAHPVAGTPAGWIYGGSPTQSCLYAIDFYLPAGLPTNQNFNTTLELKYRADDVLTAAYLNSQVNPVLGIGGGGISPIATDFANATTVQDLKLKPGRNTLYLLADDLHNAYAGINFIFKLKIHDTGCVFEEAEYTTFCECVSDWGPCGNAGQPGQGCANSTGAGSRLTASGVGSNITLHADNLPLGGTIGLFFKGTTQIGPIQFGDGLRCVGGEVERIKVVITNTGQADHGPVPSGYLYQFWYRDNSGPCGSGFNLSSAISIP